MSHIPSSAMPHAHATEGANENGATRQEEGGRPEPEATTATPDQPALGTGTTAEPLATSATDRAQDMAAAGPSGDDEPPLSSAAPGTATGNREGSGADATARASGGAATGGQSGVDGTVSAKEHDAQPRRDAEDGPSGALIAAMVLGGLAALGGLVAAALPLIRDREERKGKRGKGKKAKGARAERGPKRDG